MSAAKKGEPDVWPGAQSLPSLLAHMSNALNIREYTPILSHGVTRRPLSLLVSHTRRVVQSTRTQLHTYPLPLA